MKKSKSLSYLSTIILIFLINISLEEEKLRWAFEIFRHGARSPYSGLTETFVDYFGHKWEGIKELTGVGIRQHFLVGYRNRLRYIQEKKLIKENYDPREVFLISTDSNRTLMSARAQVQGLFLPGTGPKLHENQTDVAIPPVDEESYINEKEELDENEFTALPNNINIMPVHSFFTKEHFIQLQDKKVCPTTNEFYKKNKQRKEIVEFLDKMTIKYGKNLTKFITYKDENMLKDYDLAYYIFDTIITEYTEGVDELKNVTKELGVTEKELLDDAYQFFFLDLFGNGIDNDRTVSLYSMSPIFNKLLLWMDKKIQKDIEGDEDYTEYDLPKFVMFSAHDSTCGAFMGFMKAVFNIDILYPYFASNLYLELVRKDIKEGEKITEKDYRIEYYNNDKFMLSIPYTDFKKKVNENMKSMREINEFCGFTKKQEEISDNTYLFIDIGLAVLLLILIILIVIVIRKKRSEEVRFDEIEPLNSRE